jgi:hypothetical protein
VHEPLIYLAMSDGKAVGMRGFFGTQWESGIPTQKSIVLYADDLVIAPEHRNRGLVPKIMTTAFKELAKGGYQYAFNLSAGPTTLISSLTMGWRYVGSMQPMRQRSWRVAFRGGLDRLVARLPVLSRGIDTASHRLPQKRRPSLAEIEVKRIRRILADLPHIELENVPRCTAMAELVVRIGNSRRIRHVRDREYFDWRFQNPLSEYRFLFWTQARLEGYLVLQEYTSAFASEEITNIVDSEASSTAVHAELLRAATKLTAGRRLIIWSVNLPRQTTALLEEAGFKLIPQPESVAQRRNALLVRPICEQDLHRDWLFGGLPMLDMNSWDLRMLYSMVG